MVFERYTEPALRVIMLAQEESRRFGWNFVGTEQILLGVLRERNGLGAKALEKLGVDLANTREHAERITGRGPGVLGIEIPFTPRAKRVIELSLKEAGPSFHDGVRTDHILLALVSQDDGVAVEILRRLNIDLSEIRSEIEKLRE